MRDKLTKEEVKELVILDLEAKAAKKKYELRRSELLEDVAPGKSEYAEIGCVNKTVSIRSSIDSKQIFLDHPEIDPDDYTSTSEVTTIKCTSYLPVKN